MIEQLDLFHQAPVEPEPRLEADPEPQPTQPFHRCQDCGHVGDDVIFGCCQTCFDTWAAKDAA